MWSVCSGSHLASQSDRWSKVAVLREEPGLELSASQGSSPEMQTSDPTLDQQVCRPVLLEALRCLCCMHRLRAAGVGEPRPQGLAWVPGVHWPSLPTAFLSSGNLAWVSRHGGVGEPHRRKQNGPVQNHLHCLPPDSKSHTQSEHKERDSTSRWEEIQSHMRKAMS